MAILVSAKDLTKVYGSRTLFSNLDFVIESEERVGLIGPNGAGKSTLLKMLAGDASVDGGEISFQRGIKIGFLEQTPKLNLDEQVEEAILAASTEKIALARELISKLELDVYSHQKLSNLSGGWKKRVALARELIKEPDLLLLDEPTNHLDIESIAWLEGFLSIARFATVVITHDRFFLQRVSNRILELDRRNPGGLLNVRGNYEIYLQRKEELLSSQKKMEDSLSNKLRREREWLQRGAKARTTKQQARIQAAGVLEEQVADLQTRNQHRTAKIEFQTSDKQPKRLIEAKKISKTFGDRVLFQDLDLFLGPGDRVGLLGTNGCGKSTLIRILLEQEKPDQGTVLFSKHLNVAYFEQNREVLNPNLTLRKTLCPDGDQVNFRGRMIHIKSYLDRFLFRAEQADLPVGRLSGGEQSRILIAKLMLQEANVLVLDEPTNDLDVETLEILQDCLVEFEGGVLLVTHDRYFLDQVATQIVAFPSDSNSKGKLETFADLYQWENWKKVKKQSVKEAKADEKSSSAANNKKKKLSYNEVRELSQMEKKIEEAEKKLGALELEIQSPEIQSRASKLTEFYNEMAKVQAEIEKLYARWAELEAIQSEIAKS